MKGTVKIDLWDGVTPYKAVPWWVAYAVQKPLHDELDRLIKNKIFASLKADEMSEESNSFICMNKPNGEVRLCIDPSKLNDQIIWPVHNSWWLVDILPKLANTKYFIILDAKSGYQNLELGDKSSLPYDCMYRCFCFLRLPFGLCCLSDIFQCKINNLFDDIETACNIADDIITWGYEANGSDHNRCAKQIMKWCDQKNLKLNPGKCIMIGTHMPFYGFVVSKLGLQPDLGRVYQSSVWKCLKM